jgi:hypothetical protein
MSPDQRLHVQLLLVDPEPRKLARKATKRLVKGSKSTLELKEDGLLNPLK